MGTRLFFCVGWDLWRLSEDTLLYLCMRIAMALVGFEAYLLFHTIPVDSHA